MFLKRFGLFDKAHCEREPHRLKNSTTLQVLSVWNRVYQTMRCDTTLDLTSNTPNLTNHVCHLSSTDIRRLS